MRRVSDMDLPVMPPVRPMLAKSVKGIPDPAKFEGGLSFEPKWDGFRCIVLRNGGVGDFWLEDVGDVVVEDRYRIRPSHGQGDESVGAERGLKRGEVAR